MLLALLIACAPDVDTAAADTAYVYTGPAWRPIVDGWRDGNALCGTMDGPCFDCVELSTNWYVRWEYDGKALPGDEWRVLDFGTISDVEAGDGSCTAITLGAPIPE
ncbi:MAG: hypothetical protein ACO3UX_11320 [Candidatus Nanopelagicales bacterium]